MSSQHAVIDSKPDFEDSLEEEKVMILDDVGLSPTPHEEPNDISIIQDVQIIEMSQSRYQSHNHQRIESEPSRNPTENLISSSSVSQLKSDGKLQVGKVVRNLK